MAGKVTVACKWPNGVVLKVFDFIDIEENHAGGTRTIKQAVQRGKTVYLNGYLKPNKGQIQQPAQAAFYEMTHGVDEDFMKLWMQQNRESDLVRNKIILVQGGPVENIKSAVKEMEKQRCGVEPLDPKNLPSVVRAVSTFNKQDEARH